MMGYLHGENSVPTQTITGAGSGSLKKVSQGIGALVDYYWLDGYRRISYLRQPHLYSALQAESGDEAGELKHSLTTVINLAQATDLVQSVVAGSLAKSMRMGIEEIDVNRPVSSSGVDSLVAAEMRKWCFRGDRAGISDVELLSGNSIIMLAKQIATRSALVPKIMKEKKPYEVSLRTSSKIS